jgi:FMN-dependent NADH-azoreductase
MNLLRIDSGLLGTRSTSRELTETVVGECKRVHPNTQVVYRDLVTTVTGHLSASATPALTTGAPPAAETEGKLALYEYLVSEFLAADASSSARPCTTSAYRVSSRPLDAVTRPGRTFEHTAQGPRGLSNGKRAITVSTHGNVCSSRRRQAADRREPHLRAVLQLMSVEDVAIVRAEGLNISPASREETMAEANRRIADILSATNWVAVAGA